MVYGHTPDGDGYASEKSSLLPMNFFKNRSLAFIYVAILPLINKL
jgi:hypothetical protein